MKSPLASPRMARIVNRPATSFILHWRSLIPQAENFPAYIHEQPFDITLRRTSRGYISVQTFTSTVCYPLLQKTWSIRGLTFSSFPRISGVISHSKIMTSKSFNYNPQKKAYVELVSNWKVLKDICNDVSFGPRLKAQFKIWM